MQAVRRMLAVISLVLTALRWIIILDVILSWVMPDTEQFPRNVTTQITDPLYAPIRMILSPRALMGIDVAPLVVLLLIQGMQSMMARAALG
jgi:YggT family protein